MRWTAAALLVSALSMQAGQSLEKGSGQSRPLPKLFAQIEDWRIEFRIHGFHFNDSYQTIVGTNSFAIQLNNHNPGFLIRSWRDGSQTCTAGFDDRRTDVIVRLQRRGSTRELTAEVWNTRDGAGYLRSVCGIERPGTPNDENSTFWVSADAGALAYVRLYNSTVAPGTPPESASHGALLDYEFEGSAKETVRGANLAVDGARYGATPAYPPASVFGQFGQPRTFRVTDGTLRLDGSPSFSSGDSAALKFAWKQTAGPSEGKFSDPSAKVTTFSAALPGTYVIELTVSDSSGLASSTHLKIGGVKTDARGLIVSGNPTMDQVLGPLTAWGTSPWPWYDLTALATADALAPWQTRMPLPGTPLSGKITIPAQDPYDHMKVTGTGTRFTAEVKPNDDLGFQWKTPDGSIGQQRFTVQSVIDDTHLTTWAGAHTWPIPLVAPGVSKLDESQYTFWGGSQTVSTNWNFYDNVLALYRLYYRTGIDDYRDQARTLADAWYLYELGHGYSIVYPMYAGLDGLILRALDGKPAYWEGILRYLRYPIGWTGQFKGKLPPGSEIEPRNTGYALRAAALTARIHPDPKVREEFCGYITNAVTNVWPNVQDDLGNFEEDVYGGNPTYAYKAYRNHYGSSPWRGTLALLGLEAAYDTFTSEGSCRNPAAAAITLKVVSRFADFVHDYGTGSGKGQLYSVGYETVGQDPLGYEGFNKNTPHTAGTLSVTQGSTVVVGEGTNFTKVFWKVPGATNAEQPRYYGNLLTTPTKYIGIPARDCHKVFEVASVQSDTRLTLTQPWTCRSETKITASGGWVATWEGGTNCGTSRAAHCEGGPGGDRNLTHDIHAAYGWLAVRMKSRKYLDWAETSLAADYGGPAGGPGSSGPGAGPQADGGHGNFSDALPPCGTVPCGGYGPDKAMGKPFGMSDGAGNAPNALAYLIEARELLRN